MNETRVVVVKTRRYCIASCLALAALGLCVGAAAALPAKPEAAKTPAANKASPTILVVGDSLSAEYGLKRGEGWVALLEKELVSEQIPGKVVNASISGDTTSGGRSRLPALLAAHKPAVVVIELGGNDALRGLPITMTKDNLAALTTASQKSGAKVLLLGMQLPPNYGADYGEKFAATYAAVAKSQKAELVPFFLKGVADNADALKLFQPDRIHPKAEAHPIMLRNVWPALIKTLKAK